MENLAKTMETYGYGCNNFPSSLGQIPGGLVHVSHACMYLHGKVSHT
mgnify:CR=1 FL=1